MRTFWRGFKEGTLSSALWLGIFGGLYGAMKLGAVALGVEGAVMPGSLLAATELFFPLGTVTLLAVAAAGIFSGIMSIWRAQEEMSSARELSRAIVRDAETRSITRLQERGQPTAELDMELGDADVEIEDRIRGRRWTDRLAANRNANAKLQAILDGGGKEKLAHAEALALEREQAALNLSTEANR